MRKTIHVTPASASLDLLLKSRLQLLNKRGFEIVGFSTDQGLSGKENHGSCFEDAGFRFIESRYLSRHFSIPRDIMFFWESYRLFINERPDVVNTYGPKPGIFARIAARLAGVPVVIHTSWGLYFEHNSPWYRKLPIILVDKFAALFCDYIFSVNREDLAIMNNFKFKARGKLGYMGNGTDISKFNPGRVGQEELGELRTRLGIKPGSLIVGMVGRLTASKGFREFFDAARAIKTNNDNVDFIVIGPLDHARGGGISEKEIERLENDGVIIYLGSKGHDEMPIMYALMDIVVLPSYREGFPRSLVEAAAMGKPLIASDIRGCREAVEGGYNGYLVPVKNSSELQSAIEKLLSVESLRIEMGKNSRRKAESEFDEVNLVNRVIDVYNELLRHKRNRGFYAVYGKRTLDFLVSIIGLFVSLPIFLVMSLVIFISMGRPILFRQLRPGYKEKLFMLYKFRTMREACDRDGNLLPDEQRLTAVGALIRQLSLDELPQLYNVLRGDISLVGPRPLLIEYLPLYNDEQRRRHDVKPGITGWAQVKGRNALSWGEKFLLDTWYVDNVSFWLDIKILCLTIIKVIRREGIITEGMATTDKFRGN